MPWTEDRGHTVVNGNKQPVDKDGFQMYISPKNRRNSKMPQKWNVNVQGVYLLAPQAKSQPEKDDTSHP